MRDPVLDAAPGEARGDVIPMYDELIEELRQHHCDAKEDDTQEVCEECAYDVIIADKSAPSGIASVCVCGLMNSAADAIEELQKQLREEKVDNVNLTGWLAEEHAKHLWIPVTERLPREQETVLIWGKQGVILLDWRHDNKWSCFRDVTHWMPLPKPPESDGE